MIVRSSVPLSQVHSAECSNHFCGQGTVKVQQNSDVLTLKTRSETFMLHAPGHPFCSGDEVIFEYTNGSFDLQKPTTRSSEPGTAAAAMYTGQQSIDTLSEVALIDLVTKTLENIGTSKNVTIAYICQLSSVIESLPLTEQTKALLELVETIQKTNTVTADQIEKMLSLLNDLKKVLTEPPISVNGVSPLTVILDQKIDDGIYKFTNLSSALVFLKAENNKELGDYLQTQIRNDGSVLLRAFSADPASSGISLFNTSMLPNEIRTFLAPTNTSSRTAFPVQLLTKCFHETGYIDRPLLESFSNIPVTLSDSIVPRNERPDEAALLQWLLTVSKNKSCINQLSERFPSNCVSILKNALTELQDISGTSPISMDKIGILPDSFGKNATSVFVNKIKAIGLTLENDLLKGTVTGPTLKSELLNLIASAGNEKMESRNPTPAGTAAGQNHTVNSPEVRIETMLSRLREVRSEVSTQSRVTSITIGENLLLSEREIATLLKSIKESSVKLLNQNQSVNPVVNLSPQVASGLHADIRQKISQCSALIASMMKTIGNIPEFESIKNVIIELNSEFSDIGVLLDSKNTIVKPAQISVADSINEKLNEIVTTHDKFKLSFNELTSESSLLQKPAETLLHRLESMQLLLRQTPTQEGTSQIIALPVKIGQEWTELTLRIIKKENSGSTSQEQKHYTVYLDVAPSQLGSIHATLNYEKGRNLSIQMLFEHKELTTWFAANCEHIRKILQNNNIHFVNIDFKTATPVVNTVSQCDSRTDNNTNIDIKV